MGDAVESRLPLPHRLARAFGRDGEDHALVAVQDPDQLVHEPLGSAAIDRDPAEPPHHGPRRAAEQLPLGDEAGLEPQREHHGHADENSIALLMSGGSVLLHDGGYRPDLPSGQYGAWRADYFHNRVVARKNKRDKTQNIYEFLRNSGAYRKVRTQKIDFLKFKDVDASRTRLVDDELGYQWDRVITWLRNKEMFVVIDGIKILRPDYYTFTNLWHTRQIRSQSDRLFDTAIDNELPVVDEGLRRIGHAVLAAGDAGAFQVRQSVLRQIRRQLKEHGAHDDAQSPIRKRGLSP